MHSASTGTQAGMPGAKPLGGSQRSALARPPPLAHPIAMRISLPSSILQQGGLEVQFVSFSCCPV